MLLVGSSFDIIGNKIAEWRRVKTGLLTHPPFSAMAWVDKRGEIELAIIFNDYTKYSIEGHIYGPNKFNISKFRAILRYTFIQMGCLHLRAKPKSTDLFMCRSLERLGFKKEAILSQYYGLYEDAIVYKFLAKDALKWIKIDAKWSRSSECS